MTFEQRSIYSGPVRRALENLDRKVSVLEGGGGGSGGTGSGYVHNQGIVAASWPITHNLGFFPNVTVEDSAGTTVEGEITFTNANQLTLTFSAAFSGIAYLS